MKIERPAKPRQLTGYDMENLFVPPVDLRDIYYDEIRMQENDIDIVYV